MSSKQLIFDLPSRPAFSREDFMVSPANEQALTALENWENWPDKRLAIIGPSGAGKTHLAHVWSTLSGAHVMAAKDLALPTPSGPLALDDADDLAKTNGEETLFHLYNAMASAKTPLLITAKTPPAQWGVALPDLMSRLSTIPVVAMSAPDDTLLGALLVKQFRDKQVDVDIKLITYLMKRVDRSFDGVQAMVEKLDRAAIAEKSAISVSLARRILSED